jgi:ankyrin repeat protein
VVSLLLANSAFSAEERQNALIFAASQGAVHSARALLDGGADHSALDGGGLTSLHCASTSGHVEVIKLLINRGAQIEVRTPLGLTPLIHGAERGHLDVCKALLEAGAAVNARSLNGRTALHAAAEKGHLPVCQLLVQSGAEVNAVANDCVSPIYDAARKGHLGVLCSLLKRGANPNLQDVFRNTALAAAIMHGKVLCAKALIGVTDLSLRDSNGRLSLHSAAMEESTECLELLLPRFADVDVRSVQGRDPTTGQLRKRFGKKFSVILFPIIIHCILSICLN